LRALTGLRLFAALAIFNVHFLPNLVGVPPEVQYCYDALRSAGVAGVSMFFALSGFILAYSYDSVLFNRTALRRFYVSRISRIYPVYMLGMLWFAPFILIHRFSVEGSHDAIIKSATSFLPTALLVQSWTHPRLAVSWNGPGWSLSVEAAFYLLFPFVAPTIRKMQTSAQLKIAGLALICSATMSIVFPIVCGGWRYIDEFVRFNPIFQIPTFVFGVALGGYYLNTKVDRVTPNILTVAALTGILMVVLVSPMLPRLLVHNTIFLPLFGMLFVGLARGGVGSRLLSHPIIVLLGESSYALYILQFSIGLTMLYIVNGFILQDYFSNMESIRASGFGSYWMLLLISSLISILVFKRFEAPLRERLRGALLRS